MNIRKALESEIQDVLDIHKEAFGADKGLEIAELVEGMLKDPTALPLLSLAAEDKGGLMGHILFTRAEVKGAARNVSASILAPLAVLSGVQSTGIGAKLINEGLRLLKESGVELVFVLGHPGYYPRCGFKPAGVRGFDAPYPIPDEHADAWMVQQLRPGVIGSLKGTIEVSKVLSQPQHWRE